MVSFSLNRNIGRETLCSCQFMAASCPRPRSQRFLPDVAFAQPALRFLHRFFPLCGRNRVTGTKPIRRTQTRTRNHPHKRMERAPPGLARILDMLGTFLMAVFGLHDQIPIHDNTLGQRTSHRFNITRDPLRAQHRIDGLKKAPHCVRRTPPIPCRKAPG